MITRSAPPRASGKWIVLLCVFVALGCSAPGGYPPPRTVVTGPLPAGVDSDASAFRARIARYALSGNPHTRARAATCRPGSLDARGMARTLCSVYVKIEAVGDTRLIDPENAPVDGVPVARIENLDTQDTEAKLGLRPGIQAIYYLWVDRRPGSTKARWTLVETPMGAGIPTPIWQANLNLCHRYHEGDVRVSDADFYEYKYDDHPCDVAVSAERSTVQHAAFLPTEQLAALFGRIATFIRGESTAAEGGWISCSGGCCT